MNDYYISISKSDIKDEIFEFKTIEDLEKWVKNEEDLIVRNPYVLAKCTPLKVNKTIKIEEDKEDKEDKNE